MSSEYEKLALTGTWIRRAHFTPLRLVLAGISVCVLVLSNAYAGQLLGFFAAPPRYADPMTLAEAEPLIRHLYSRLDFKWALGHEGLWKLHEKFTLDNITVESRLDYVVQAWDDASMAFDPRKYIMRKNLTENGKPLLHLVPQCVISPGSMGFSARKNLPEFKKLNMFTMHVVESGIYEYRERQKRNLDIAQGVVIPEGVVVAREPRAKNLEQFSPTCIILGVGIGVSSIAFSLELLTDWLRRILRRFRSRRNVLLRPKALRSYRSRGRWCTY